MDEQQNSVHLGQNQKRKQDFDIFLSTATKTEFSTFATETERSLFDFISVVSNRM